jgi:hypothetical protein
MIDANVALSSIYVLNIDVKLNILPTSVSFNLGTEESYKKKK